MESSLPSRVVRVRPRWRRKIGKGDVVGRSFQVVGVDRRTEMKWYACIIALLRSCVPTSSLLALLLDLKQHLLDELGMSAVR